MAALVALACLMTAPAHAQVRARWTRVDGVAAFVGGASPGPGVATILRSDVSFRARITLASASDRLPVGDLPEGLLAATLEELITEALVANEARRLRATEPTDEEIRAHRERLEERAGGADRLRAIAQAIGADADELDGIARERAYVDAFLRANLEGVTVVSDAQVQRVFANGGHPFEGRDLEVVREPLRAWIAQQVLEREVRRWTEVLRHRNQVRVLADWRRSRVSRARVERAGGADPDASGPEVANPEATPRDEADRDEADRDAADRDAADPDPTDADPTGADPTGADPTGADSTDADPTDADPTDADETRAHATDSDVKDPDATDVC